MPELDPCEREIEVLLHKVIEDYHPGLAEAGVTFSLLWASAKLNSEGNPSGPALKLHGQPCYAIIKINSLQLRLEGLPDVTLKLDRDSWPGFSEETRRAILDHEATHLFVERDENNAPETDKAGRPKLVMREHDIVVGGFREVAERHQKDAVESQQYLEANKFFHQGDLFPWG